jgi:hypothetical protein
VTRSTDFSLWALYEALDAQRQSRGLSWAQVTRQMNGQSERSFGHALSSSTVKGVGTRRVAEADGVLQMLHWLNRTPESFATDVQEYDEKETRLPEIPCNQILRFDTKKLYAALDAQRAERKMTWPQVAKEIGLAASSLTYLSKGGRTGFPDVIRIVRWLHQPAAQFTRASER